MNDTENMETMLFEKKKSVNNCRFCEAETTAFLDLGFAPPSNRNLNPDQLHAAELTYPLEVYVCQSCWLAQTKDYSAPNELFSDDYAYFSGVSETWLAHTQSYTEMIIPKISLGKESFVVEIASNDGTLLENFRQYGIRILGVEPTLSTALVAEQRGIPTLKEFFGAELAHKMSEQYSKADLICGNNVFAHVPDIKDFTEGLKILLSADGTITLEFPHLLNLLKSTQFDTVYHEHYSYLSLATVKKIFSKADLRIHDVEEIPTHGGSLRIYGSHENAGRKISESVTRVLQSELDEGLLDIRVYNNFQKKIESIKWKFLNFLLTEKLNGKTIAGYGAAAKGNTLLNFCGIKSDLIDFVCDGAESKQGRYTPGSHIPILSPSHLQKFKPDWVIIFPWNIAQEIINQQRVVHSWGGRFVTVIPELKIY